jgi:protein-S-isoprenylcysteine O-methyltransferase Ste14
MLLSSHKMTSELSFLIAGVAPGSNVGDATMTTAAMPQPNSGGTARVIGRPPLLLLIALIAGAGLDHLLPLSFPIGRVGLAHWISAFAAAVMIILAISFVAAGMRNFSRADTPVPTTRPTRALVTTGIHGRTRNPIYLGMLLLQVGLALLTRSPWILIAALPLAITLRYGVIAREEAYLEQRFGGVYRDYKGRVRRWI